MENNLRILIRDSLQAVENMDDTRMEELADLFSAFGEVTRLRILILVRRWYTVQMSPHAVMTDGSIVQSRAAFLGAARISYIS